MKKPIEFTEDELADLIEILMSISDQLGYRPLKFAAILSVAASHLAEIHGIEVMGIKRQGLPQ